MDNDVKNVKNSDENIIELTDEVSESDEIDSYIVIKLRLTNEKLDETFFLVCKIISCDRIDDFEGKYSNRAKFMFKDIKDRETIVKYVFEEQRRIRKKENG